MWGYVDDQLEIFETHVLKVHINCEGCELKVRKLLNKIEGVYSVTIDKEQELVMVSGSVEPATLVKKLAKSGKVAELWLPAPESYWNQGQDELHQIQHTYRNIIPDQYKFPAYYGNGNNDIEIIENFSNQNFGMKAVDSGADRGTAEKMMRNFYNLPTVEVDDMHMNQPRMSNCAMYMMSSPGNYFPQAAP